MSEVGAVTDREALSQAARAWIAGDPDSATRQELEALLRAEDYVELAERFSAPLEFGTAGLRGVVGAGLSRMNRAVVIRAARGFGEFLVSHRSGARNLPLVIGYDARPDSLRLAADMAGVLLAMGIPVRAFPHVVPTPLVAYAARALAAIAGIMVTASHNPKEYAGFKLYLDDAIQLVPPADRAIGELIARVGPACDVPRLEIEATAEALAAAGEPPPPGLFERYLGELSVSLPALPRADESSALRIAYTPLHGVGWRFVRRAFERCGFDEPLVVPEQAEPDGSFPTTPFPNPEERGSMELGLELARREQVDLLLVNDPDADRLSAAVPTPSGRYLQLTGNQIGLLLCDALLAHAREGGESRALVVASVVTTPLLGKLARARGAHFEQTLTGFKWIWTAAHALEQTRALRFIFGCEEALGYSVSAVARDKDGVGAALALAAAALRARRSGKTLLERLGELYRELGLWVSYQHSLVRPGARGALEIQAAVERLADSPPSQLAGRRVLSLRDFRNKSGGPRWLPLADLLEFELEGGRLLVRPSGTEPKLKIYVDLEVPLGEGELSSVAEERGAAQASELARALEAYLTSA